MKIVIISACAPPEPVGAGRISWDIAEYMAGINFEVWLISPRPSRPVDVKYPKVRKTTIDKVSNNFFHVRINSFSYPNFNLFLRMVESFDFGFKSIRFVNRRIGGYDLLYALPWPFIGQMAVQLFRRNKNIPLIWNIQDLYPESFLHKIKLKSIKAFFKPLYLVDRYLANKSDHLALVSDTIQQVYLFDRNIAPNKLSVIRNWQDESEFGMTLLAKSILHDKYQLGFLKDKFVFMYLGNIGPVASVDIIISSFTKLNKENSVLIIAGSGSYKRKCQTLADNLGSSNIYFIEVPLGLKPVVELQSLADVLLLPIHPEAADSSIPSKLIAYMLSKKPIITSANIISETAIAVKESNCGWITETNELKDWISVFMHVLDLDRGVLKDIGIRGYEFAINNYSKKEGLRNMHTLFFKLLNLD